MARVVILGAGISGHTAALHLQRQLKGGHEIVVVSPNSNWNWIPSNIWVGVGKMTKDQVCVIRRIRPPSPTVFGHPARRSEVA